MKSSNSPLKGSFGIPEGMEPKRKETPKEEPKQEPQEVKEETGKTPETNIVEDLQKELKIEFTGEDFQQLLFKGYVEKKVIVIDKHLDAKLKSLTGQEWDFVDEILARETKEIPMTINGMDIRKAVISLSFGIVELNGKPLTKVIKKENDELDIRAMAENRRKLIVSMAPMVTNLLMEKHGAFTQMLNFITRDPSKYLKNS